jgi:hypothetical protein
VEYKFVVAYSVRAAHILVDGEGMFRVIRQAEQVRGLARGTKLYVLPCAGMLPQYAEIMQVAASRDFIMEFVQAKVYLAGRQGSKSHLRGVFKPDERSMNIMDALRDFYAKGTKESWTAFQDWCRDSGYTLSEIEEAKRRLEC